jgi:hypothetical protein
MEEVRPRIFSECPMVIPWQWRGRQSSRACTLRRDAQAGTVKQGGLLPIAVVQLMNTWLTRRHREQAPSHILTE